MLRNDGDMRLISAKAIQQNADAATTMRRAYILRLLSRSWLLGGLATAQPVFGPVSKRIRMDARKVDANQPRAAGNLAGPDRIARRSRRARFALSPAGRGTVSARSDCARLDAERRRPRTNAAAGIRRARRGAGARGFAVVIPERPGHGATGGPYREDQGGCDDADYDHAGSATADDDRRRARLHAQAAISSADGPALVIGHSAGGFGALALAARDPAEIGAIIAFCAGPRRPCRQPAGRDLRARTG